MRYFAHEPAPPLGEFVHSFWDSTYAAPHSKIRILPRGTAELVFNLSEDEIRIYDFESPEQCRRFPGIVISGAYAGALDIDPMQNASMMGVHFRPGGAFPFFGAAISELSGHHLALETLWGKPATELRERLCAAATPCERFQILEQSLQSHLRLSAQHPAVSLALKTLGPVGSGGSVRAVAKSVGLSERRFIKCLRRKLA